METRAERPEDAAEHARGAPAGEPWGARFPPELRLRRAADFRLTYRDGARARGATLLVVVRPNGLAVSRVGLSVGKKCWKRAVRRNRVRRVFREAFRLARPRLAPGLDVVMIPAAPRLAPRLDETREELVELVLRAQRKLARAGSSPTKEAGDGQTSPAGPTGPGAREARS